MMEYSAEGRGSNALQQVAFVVHYEREFSDHEFEEFDKRYEVWKEDLPRRSKSNALLFQPGSQRIEFKKDTIGNLSYQSFLEDGSTKLELRLEGNQISYMVGEYTTWSDIWPRAQQHLQQAIDLLPEDNKVISYASQYQDLFRAKGSYADFQADAILCRESRFIPGHVFERKENFHFHTGYFELFNSPFEHRVLTRINADLRDNVEMDSRDLSIVLMHQLFPCRGFKQSERNPYDELLGMGLENFAVLHELDKSVRLEILNDEMAERVKLLP